MYEELCFLALRSLVVSYCVLVSFEYCLLSFESFVLRHLLFAVPRNSRLLSAPNPARLPET